MKIIDILENTEEKLPTDPHKAFEYAYRYYNKTDERCYEAEPYIIKKARAAYYYAETVMKERWEEAEPIIMTDPYYAYQYARDVIKGRWPEAEPYIVENPWCAYEYARDVIKGRWPEAEPIIIMIDPDYAINYARDVIKGRWPEAEPIIMTGPQYAYYYAHDVIKGRWPEAEPIIMTDIYVAPGYYRYIMIPSVLKSNPNSKQIFRLLMDITKYFNKDKELYDKLIKLIFPDSSIMVDKWINYGNKQRGKK